MKKSIIAIAVSSAALASVSVHAADDATVSFYGNIQYANVFTNPSESDQASTRGFEDNGSSLGFKGESKIDESTEAFFNLKYKVPLDEKGDYDVTMDNAFIGVKGNFGTVKVGSFDSIYNDAIQDSIDQFDYLGFENAATSGEGDTVAYFSPTVSGFQLQASAGLGKTTADTSGTVSSTSNTAYTAVAKYSNDLVTVALGYDGLENENNLDSTVGLNVSVSLMENLSVSGKYETTSDDNSSNAGQDIYGLGARYGYGMGDVYASYQKIEPDSDSAKNYNQYGVGASYTINSSMYVYAEYGQVNTSSDTATQLESKRTVVGVYYGF